MMVAFIWESPYNRRMSQAGHHILYSFRRCPYAMRARMALHYSRQRCELREILLKDKPAAMLAISAKGSVPVLHLADGQVLDESLEIMLWALGHQDPGGWIAAAPSIQEQALSLIDQCDGPFKFHLDRYKYGSRYEDGDPLEHRAQACLYLQRLEDSLADTRHLTGADAMLADHAIFPFIRQFAATDRPWFDQSPFPALREWLDRMMASPLFLAVMEKHPPWSAEDPPLFCFAG